MQILSKLGRSNYWLWAYLGFWFAGVSRIAFVNPTVGLSDVFGFIDRAEYFNFLSLDSWVDGFYPFGYPLALKSLAFFLRDYELSGKAISLLSGAMCIIFVFFIGKIILGSLGGFISALIVSINPSFVYWSTNSGTDMTAAFLTTGSLFFLARLPSSDEKRISNACWAGSLLGLAYLIRYTSICVLPFWLAWAIYIGYKTEEGRIRHSLKYAYAVLFFFLLLVSPQLVLSFVDKGNPFYNKQVANVCFGLIGNFNWGENWHKCESYSGSILSLLFEKPRQVLFLYLHNNREILFSDFLPRSQKILLLITLPLAILRSNEPRPSFKPFLLVIGAIISFCFFVSFTYITSRYLLPVTILVSIPVSYGILALIYLLPRNIQYKSLPASFILVFAVSTSAYNFSSRLYNPIDHGSLRKILVSHEFEKLIKPTSEKQKQILQLSFDYCDLSSRLKTRYGMNWFDPADMHMYSTVQGIYRQMLKNKQTYLLFDNSAPGSVAGLHKSWPFSDSLLAKYFDPVWEYRDIRILRIKPSFATQK